MIQFLTSLNFPSW